jgi:hypothetical protein
MPTKTWKNKERQVAGFFGTKRCPLSGSNSGHDTCSDSLHDRLYIEQKHRRRHAVLEVWRQAKRCAEREGKTPLVSLTEHGRHGFWVLCHCDDLRAVLEQLNHDGSHVNSPETLPGGGP